MSILFELRILLKGQLDAKWRELQRRATILILDVRILLLSSLSFDY